MGLRTRRLAFMDLPTPAALLQRLGPDSEVSRATQQAELDEWRREVERATRLGAELPRALSRVTLASGTALALLGWIQHSEAPPWPAVLAAFFAGWIGALGIAWLGRIAATRARRAREHWRGVVQKVRSTLEIE